ncbi:MAG TPA: L-seryl-tRNA(Sec) selenium transferase [Terriglobia bacterium]|nr:L-seryl-tRNA(Sec) selenium transferase [Terriglobia bacterium]
METPTESDRITTLLRRIPAVEALLNRGSLQELAKRLGRQQVVNATRAVLENLREKVKEDSRTAITLESIEKKILAAAEAAAEPSLRPVINATGVILHTNLGRAPLAREALAHVAEVATEYSNLEYDLELGERGKRDAHTARLFSQLLGTETALVVNNNAAAVFLALNTLAEGAEVIVSRGELVEIGGSFRIPDICAKSGAALREVGTTNRTRVSDYAAAINERTRLLLRVHPSNFRITGFTERPALRELVDLARKHNLPLMEDLGSGCLVDLAPFGLREESVVSESLKAGVNIVTFSGDKLLGGPQAGILLGQRDLLSRIRKNPLFRALRVDKLTIAAIEATIALYLREDYTAIPTQRMIRAPVEEIAERARQLGERLRALDGFSISLQDGESAAGGGSTPGQSIPTRLIAVTHITRTAQELTTALRENRPPIIARIEEDRLVLDLRTVLDPEQEEEIFKAFQRLSANLA